MRIPTALAVALAMALTSAAQAATAAAKPAQAKAILAAGPVEMRVNNLKDPLGLDDAAPSFSWQLRDASQGARQTAYELTVTQAGKPVWQSGRVTSGQSLNVRYAGPKLKPETRYIWRVKLWGENGTKYPESAAAWFETGLMTETAWRAQWIGFETPEEAAVRHASSEWIANPEALALEAEKITEKRTAFRQTITLTKPVKRAVLNATAQDTVTAWVNGAKVLQADPFPGWKQMPWKKFVRADVTAQLKLGANLLAIEGLHYATNSNSYQPPAPPPMMATLYVVYADGSTATFGSDAGWKTAIHAAPGWEQTGFDDAGWKQAVTPRQDKQLASSAPGKPWIPDSVKALRHEFAVASPVKSARLYATALGTYEFYLNGKRVSEDYFAPGWTDYREHVLYQTYDVTALLAQGTNALAALLAPGWYSTPLEWFQQPNNYGLTPPALRAQLRIEHADGTVEWVATDTSWKASESEILSSELYDGESEDARREQPGWTTAAFAAKNWHAAEIVEPAPVKIEAQEFPAIRPERSVVAKAQTEPAKGVYVYDLGQNLVGVERIKVNGTAGEKVRLRFAELLNDDGSMYVENLRTAKATDYFTLKGGAQILEPHFTFHGFRYIEITGLDKAPAKEAVEAVVLHTAAPVTVKLSTSNAMIEKLWNNILWGQRSNFVGLPTDCPQRDERLGWTADAQVFWRAASYNMDLAAFSRKFAADLRGTQQTTPYYATYAPGTAAANGGSGAGWSDAGVVIPWTSWLQTGDTRAIDENWAAMEKYLTAIEAANPDYLRAKENGIPFGDWLSPEGITDYTLISTAYWAYDATLMRQMAHATERTADEQKYAALFEKIRDAFAKKFVHADGFVAGADDGRSPFGQLNNPDAKPKGGDTQTGYVLALHMNLVPDDLRAKAAAKLAAKIEANHGLLSTGFLGTPYLLEALVKAGNSQLAYRLLLNTAYPSWGYLVEHGATTMWERWNGDQMKSDPSMNSYNHYAYGAVADWIYRYAAGVDATPLDAGFHTVVLRPHFDARLGQIALDYESSYGPIHSDWTVKGATAEWHVTLPANTTGWLSADTAEGLKLAGAAVSTKLKAEKQGAEDGFALPSGSYSFEATVRP